MILKRIAVHPSGAYGALLHKGIPFAVTLEHTYDDQRNIVKIPPGSYRCTRTRYHRGGYDTFEVHVPGHSRILFHRGNWEGDSDGCILVGEYFNKKGIALSGDAFKEFMLLTQDVDSFDLTVIVCE